MEQNFISYYDIVNNVIGSNHKSTFLTSSFERFLILEYICVYRKCLMTKYRIIQNMYGGNNYGNGILGSNNRNFI